MQFPVVKNGASTVFLNEMNNKMTKNNPLYFNSATDHFEG